MPIIWTNSTIGQTLADNDEGYLLPGRFIATTSGDAIRPATSSANAITVLIDGSVAALAGSAIRLGPDGTGVGFNKVSIGATGIVRGESSFGVSMTGSSNTLENAGQISARQVVTMIGDGVNLLNTGSMIGSTSGVITNGANGAVVNHGQMIGATALSVNGTDNSIYNTGLMQGEIGGLGIGGDNVSVVNDGQIIAVTDQFGSGVGVLANPFTSSVSLYNSGLIAGPDGAYRSEGANAVDEVVNSGEMRGDVSLGGGADIYRGVGDGSVDGRVFGGGGADTLSGGAQADRLTGGSGADMLKGLAGDDTLSGSGGADVLRGHRGDDVLNGGAGGDRLNGGRDDDTLTGGGAGDHFVFKRQSGDDLITDFVDGTDLIDLTAFGFFPNQFATEVAPALSNAGSGDTFLDLTQLGGDGSVLIQGLSFSRADAADFIL